MRLNKKLLFGTLAASAMVLASCSNEEVVSVQQPVGEVYGTGSNLVTFTITSEDAVKATRADISDGSQADVLLFAVYEKKGDDYVLAPEFKKKENTVNKVEAAEGQNLLSVSKYPLTIQLATDPSKTYKVAFWAQNSNCDAFVTEDLTAVRVRYPGVDDGFEVPALESKKNNDELRDAFCAVSNAFSGKSNKEEVIMHRPFAQINVGTSGADYANIVQGANMFPNRRPLYSKVIIKGAANTIDVLNDVISGSQDLVFDWNKIPAYVFTNVPSRASYGSDEYYNRALITGVTNEQYLKVNLNEPDNFEYEITKYKTDYPTREKGEVEGTEGKYLTETFKYLSMCYVLVPTTKKDNAETLDSYTDIYQSSVLNNLTVMFAENPDGTDNMVDKDAEGNAQTSPAYSYLSIDQVPVHRNWRTNILGGLKFTDPKDPDDETSIFSTTRICIHLCPIYWGENNGIVNSGTVTQWFDPVIFPIGDGSWHDKFENKH